MKLTIAVETTEPETDEVTTIRLRIRRGASHSRPGVSKARRRTVTTQGAPSTDWARVVPLRRVG